MIGKAIEFSVALVPTSGRTAIAVANAIGILQQLASQTPQRTPSSGQRKADLKLDQSSSDQCKIQMNQHASVIGMDHKCPTIEKIEIGISNNMANRFPFFSDSGNSFRMDILLVLS